VSISGGLFGNVTGQVEYSRIFADWHAAGSSRGLRRLAPAVVRHGPEQLHDLLASMEASFREARTRVQLVYRMNTALRPDEEGVQSLPGSRFDLQIHQALPYKPITNGRLELLFAVRTLFRDPREEASFYDELLTISPPMRFMGGIQLRF
jgi:hypothetical protein